MGQMLQRPDPRDEESGFGPYTNSAPRNSPARPGNSVRANPVRDSRIDDLIKAAESDLVTGDSGENTVLNVATLQRLVIFQLQLKIIKKSGPIVQRRFGTSNPLDDDELKKALTEYAQAVRDWELMVDYNLKAAGDRDKDPFCISSKWKLTRQPMEDAGLRVKEDIYHTGTLDAYIGVFKQRNKVNRDRSWKAFTLRLSMAVFGGVALIGPMLLMVLHNDMATDLATTSVAVFVVAIIISVYSTATPEGIVGTIAAYAAVLVVFVGTLLGR
ncbi:hypothetical protein F4803DRAFT_541892 [Xylaria telfairii]|nr:hypothetical protein F4803DRAFT_541892 [Xylaria telfairii]